MVSRARYRCDARAAETARRAGRHDAAARPCSLGGAGCEESWSRIRPGTSSSSCRPPAAAGGGGREREYRRRQSTAHGRRTSSAPLRSIVTRSGCKARPDSAVHRATRPCSTCWGSRSDTQYRYTTLTVPTSGLIIELIEFKGARRPAAPARIAGSGLDAHSAARRGHRRRGRGAHAGRRHVHLDGRQTARSARGQRDARRSASCAIPTACSSC